MIRPVTLADAEAIALIYNHYVLETAITFEEVAIPPTEMAERIARTIGAGLPWLVAEQGGRVIGYSYASKWKDRTAYRFSVETTIYLAPDCHGNGVGTSLYRELHTCLKEMNFHTAIGGIIHPNPASQALHEKLGYRKVAHLSEIGFKFGKWIDVCYWQCLLQ
jgi:L-amino acid N-acyltransferase YncA